MNNKVILGLVLSLIFITSIGIGFYAVKIREVQEFEMEYTSQALGEKITDECTDEAQELLEASATEHKVPQMEEGTDSEHYVLREEDERIVVYTIDEQNNEKIIERTGIITKYLPETDRINIQNGILVNGKEALKRLLEDYE